MRVGATDICSPEKNITAKIISGQNAIIGGLNFAKETFKLSDKKISFQAKTRDGKKVRKNKVVAILKGGDLGILNSERVALNFLVFI